MGIPLKREGKSPVDAAMAMRAEAKKPFTQAKNPYATWAWRVCFLVGILPLAVLGLPRWAMMLFPIWSFLHVAMSLLLPMSAWLVRFVIFSRSCEYGRHRIWQAILFLVATSLVLMQEMLLVVFRTLAPDLWGHDPQWWRAFWSVYLSCLVAVAIAFFPLAPASLDSACQRTRMVKNKA